MALVSFRLLSLDCSARLGCSSSSDSASKLGEESVQFHAQSYAPAGQDPATVLLFKECAGGSEVADC